MGDHDANFDRPRVVSLAEKKRLWWRNGFINGAFIASWCVSTWRLARLALNMHHQVYILHHNISV